MDDDPLGSGDDEPNSEDEEKDFDTEDTIACQWEKVRERDRKFQQLCPTTLSFEAEKFDTHHQESHCSILYNLFGYVNLWQLVHVLYCALKQLVHVLYCALKQLVHVFGTWWGLSLVRATLHKSFVHVT